jgi:hypothetical protein
MTHTMVEDEIGCAARMAPSKKRGEEGCGEQEK